MTKGKRLFAAMGLVLALLAATAGAQGPVGYWPLDGNGNDLSGNSLNGTISGTVTTIADRMGNTSGALRFTGLSSSEPGTRASRLKVQNAEDRRR